MSSRPSTRSAANQSSADHMSSDNSFIREENGGEAANLISEIQENVFNTNSTVPVGSGLAMPAPPVGRQQSVNVNLNQINPIELEHLNSLPKLEEHFAKFLHKNGTGRYVDFLSQDIKAILKMAYVDWSLGLTDPPGCIFEDASRVVLEVFIRWFANNELNSGTSKLNDEANFRSKLAELSFHSFLDLNTGKQRNQDYTVSHVRAFIGNVIKIFGICQRNIEDNLFPVTELKTFRDTLSSWLKEIKDKAPPATSGFFTSLAEEMTIKYVLSEAAYARDNAGLGPFLMDLKARIAIMENTFRSSNALLMLSIVSTARCLTASHSDTLLQSLHWQPC